MTTEYVASPTRNSAKRNTHTASIFGGCLSNIFSYPQHRSQNRTGAQPRLLGEALFSFVKLCSPSDQKYKSKFLASKIACMCVSLARKCRAFISSLQGHDEVLKTFVPELESADGSERRFAARYFR